MLIWPSYRLVSKYILPTSMKIIIPMAGRGTRLSPHTFTTPKSLIPIAGKPIVQRIVEDTAKICDDEVDEVAFVIGHLSKEIEDSLIKIAENIGAKGSIYYQENALGLGHAVLCAKESLVGKVVVVYGDTLFKADLKLDSSKDGIICVYKVEDPRPFGVVTVDADNMITGFVEKPQEFVSDLAIIGVCYFQNGEYLRSELQYLVDNNITQKGEYQITSAMENMRAKGTKFFVCEVTEWLDCGNKDATVYSNSRILEIDMNIQRTSNFVNQNSIIIEPCFVGEGVQLINSIIGPYVSVGENTILDNSIVKNSIIQANSRILHAELSNSMIGNNAEFTGTSNDASISDFSTIR